MKSKKRKAESDDEDMAEAGLSKEERRHIKKYQKLGAQMIEIALTLEKWGYSFDSQSINGETPLTLAAEN
jgi:hypothetical protein